MRHLFLRNSEVGPTGGHVILLVFVASKGRLKMAAHLRFSSLFLRVSLNCGRIFQLYIHACFLSIN